MSKRKPALIEPEPASDEAPVVVAEPIDPAGESFEVPPPVEETTDSPLEPAGSPEDEASEEVVGQALKKVVEAVLFASQKPVSSKELIAVFK